MPQEYLYAIVRLDKKTGKTKTIATWYGFKKMRIDIQSFNEIHVDWIRLSMPVPSDFDYTVERVNELIDIRLKKEGLIHESN